MFMEDVEAGPTNRRHRKVLKERFIREGLDGLVDSEVIELLLFYSMPKQDTRPVARTLLESFGDLQGVVEAPFGELVALPGMDVHSSILIKAAWDFPKRAR